MLMSFLLASPKSKLWRRREQEKMLKSTRIADVLGEVDRKMRRKCF